MTGNPCVKRPVEVIDAQQGVTIAEDQGRLCWQQHLGGELLSLGRPGYRRDGIGPLDCRLPLPWRLRKGQVTRYLPEDRTRLRTDAVKAPHALTKHLRIPEHVAPDLPNQALELSRVSMQRGQAADEGDDLRNQRHPLA